MQQTNEKLITPAAYAKARGLNRSTICRQIKDASIPTHGGLIDPVEADAARDRNLSGTRRDQAARRKAERAEAAPELPPVDRPADPLREFRNAIAASNLRKIVAPAEVLKFARAALMSGCTNLQAFALGSLYQILPGLALTDLDAEDLADFPDVSRSDWRKLLGADFDFHAGGDEADRIADSEIKSAA